MPDSNLANMSAPCWPRRKPGLQHFFRREFLHFGERALLHLREHGLLHRLHVGKAEELPRLQRRAVDVDGHFHRTFPPVRAHIGAQIAQKSSGGAAALDAVLRIAEPMRRNAEKETRRWTPRPSFPPFSAEVAAPAGLRAAIAAAHRRPEPECVAALIDLAAADARRGRAHPRHRRGPGATAARQDRARAPAASRG